MMFVHAGEGDSNKNGGIGYMYVKINFGSTYEKSRSKITPHIQICSPLIPIIPAFLFVSPSPCMHKILSEGGGWILYIINFHKSVIMIINK